MYCANERSAAAASWRCGMAAFGAERLAGLYSRHRGQKPFRCTPSVEAKILNATRKPPTDGSTHWSTRRRAAKLGVSHMMVARVWHLRQALVQVVFQQHPRAPFVHRPAPSMWLRHHGGLAQMTGPRLRDSPRSRMCNIRLPLTATGSGRCAYLLTLLYGATPSGGNRFLLGHSHDRSYGSFHSVPSGISTLTPTAAEIGPERRKKSDCISISSGSVHMRPSMHPNSSRETKYSILQPQRFRLYPGSRPQTSRNLGEYRSGRSSNSSNNIFAGITLHPPLERPLTVALEDSGNVCSNGMLHGL